MNWHALDPGILIPAFAAGMVVLATHVPLGVEVLRRGIVFIDLAVAQIAGIGVIGAELAGLEASGPAGQAAALAAAMAGALLLTWTERRFPQVQEALIGVAFVLAATLALLLLAGHPHGGEHLRDLLSGQILWVGWRQIAWAALPSVAILAVLGLRRSWLSGIAFYPLFALAVTASVQLVGVYLVFASLIIPALATWRRPATGRLARAYLVGCAGYVLGIGASALLDLPTGATIVWALAVAGTAWAIAGPKGSAGA